MTLIMRSNPETLVQRGNTKDLIAKAFSSIIQEYGYGKNRVDPDKRLNMLGIELGGVGGAQISRYAKGEQTPSIETFIRFCIKFQKSPMELLGLDWREESPDRSTINTWEVKDDLKYGGFRLYWACNVCAGLNIEYLDPDGIIIEKLERREDGEYEAERQRAYCEELDGLELMCELCGECYIELKGLKDWKLKNT